MDSTQLNWIANFIWGIADDVLRDVYTRGKYRDVILPMTVIRRLRTQLRMVYEAARAVAGEPIGTVAAGDFYYEQRKPAMPQSGV